MGSSHEYSPATARNDGPGHRSGRALVLGGGGSVGNAWLIGVITGLHRAGLDVTAADLIIGTSAGSTAAAQITSARPDRLLADILGATPPPLPAGAERDGRPARRGPVVDHRARTDRIIAAAQDAPDMRRRLGAAALALEAPADWSARWRAIVAARLPGERWPATRVLITAIDALSGEPVVFDSNSGVDLVDAVAASCSSGFAYRIGDGWYLDGGYRSNADNADLAAGHERVLVLSPFGGRSRTPDRWGMHLTDQVAELRDHGSIVETLFPDRASLAVFGDDVMDATRRAPAARAGRDQGVALAAGLRTLWD